MLRNKKFTPVSRAIEDALGTSVLIVCALFFCSNAKESQKPEPRASTAAKSATIKPNADNPSTPLPVPFRVGEVLNYRVTWSVFLNAASIQLSVVERRDLFSTPTWHFRASAHSQVPLRSLAVVDDQFDSYAEIESLDSRQYETYLDELGEKQSTVLHLESTTLPRKNRPSTVLVKPHTHDPLAALYLLRTIDWQHTLEFRAPVYDGEDLYEMSARLESAAELISISGRNMNAAKISVHLFRGGQESRTKCSIWFSQDVARIPVLIEADVPYGRVRAELVSKIE
jgi:hypothetical protein